MPLFYAEPLCGDESIFDYELVDALPSWVTFDSINRKVTAKADTQQELLDPDGYTEFAVRINVVHQSDIYEQLEFTFLLQIKYKEEEET